jgi:hypothetical protein
MTDLALRVNNLSTLYRIGPRERIVAIEILDASGPIPGIKEGGVVLENVVVTSNP